MKWRLYRARTLVWLALRDKEHFDKHVRAALKDAHYELTKAVQQ